MTIGVPVSGSGSTRRGNPYTSPRSYLLTVLTNQEMAQRQYLSVSAVKATVTRIFDKLGVTNRVQLAILVHDAGLQ